MELIEAMAESSNTKALKSGIWYTIANFMVKGAGFITTPIFVRLLSSEDVGAFSNVQAWFSIIVAIARFDFKGKLDEYIASTLVLGTSITVMFYIVVLMCKNYLMQLLSIDFYSLNLIFTYCLVYPAFQMFMMKSRILYKYKLSTILSLGTVFSSVFGSLLLVLVVSDKFWGRVTGYYIPLITINIVIYIIIIVKAKKISTKYWGYALKISFPLIWHTLAGNLLTSCDRVMITKYCGESANAFYSVAYSCAMAVSVLWSSMNTAWSPWAYEKMDARDYEVLKKASKPYSLFFGVVVLCFMLVSPEVLLIMGGSAYKAAIGVIPPVMVGYVFQFTYSLYVNIEFYHKKQIWIAAGTIISACVNIGLNYLLIPRFGYTAAAYTTLFGYIVLFTIHFLIVNRMGKAYWYDSKFNLIFLGVFFMLIPLVNVLYKITIMRYIIIFLTFGVMCVITIRHRKYIVLSIKTKSLQPFIECIRRRK